MIMTADKKISSQNRIDFLDGLRGLSIIVIVIFHMLYDVGYFFNTDLGFFSERFQYPIQLIFPAMFFIVSGICTAFSRNSVRRGAMLFLLGQAITIITSVFIPEEIIIFGVITFIGCSMMIYEFIKHLLNRIPWRIVFIVSLLLYIVLFRVSDHQQIFLFYKFIDIDFPDNYNYLYPIGIKYSGFYSSDYFPIIPNIFLFIAGTALSRPINEKKFPKWFYRMKMPVFNIIGRKSLIIYIVHQPVIFAIMTTIKFLKG